MFSESFNLLWNYNLPYFIRENFTNFLRVSSEVISFIKVKALYHIGIDTNAKRFRPMSFNSITFPAQHHLCYHRTHHFELNYFSSTTSPLLSPDLSLSTQLLFQRNITSVITGPITFNSITFPAQHHLCYHPTREAMENLNTKPKRPKRMRQREAAGRRPGRSMFWGYSWELLVWVSQ